MINQWDTQSVGLREGSEVAPGYLCWVEDVWFPAQPSIGACTATKCSHVCRLRAGSEQVVQDLAHRLQHAEQRCANLCWVADKGPSLFYANEGDVEAFELPIVD